MRNNPLNLVDPSGKKAVVTVTYDKEKKTYNIHVKASFGVYVESGNLSQKEINRQIDLLKTQLTTAYNDQFSGGNGNKLNLSISIDVKQYSSETAAVKDASENKIDNIVGLVEGTRIGGGEPGKTPSPRAMGRGYRVEGESFDRMLVATNSAATYSTYAHEFGHLLNSEHQDRTKGIMNTAGAFGKERFNANDFNVIFTKYLDKVNQSKLYINNGRKEIRLWVENARARAVFKKKSTIFPLK